MKTELKIGQEVAVRTQYSTTIGYKVVKITPSGRITVQGGDGRQKVFRADLREYPQSKYSYAQIEIDLARVKIQLHDRQKANDAVGAMDKLYKNTSRVTSLWSKENMLHSLDEFQTLLDAARVAVMAR